MGWPLELDAVFYETDSPPFQVEFPLGKQVGNPSDGIRLQVIGTLGSFESPPFSGSWIPTNVGRYFIWARSTNSSGIVQESPATEFDIYAENDDFLRATIIPPETTATNYVFNIAWTSVEPGEPSHKTAAARYTRWWKWTPAHSQSVRLKAVQDMMGFPIDVFTGTSLLDLHRVTSNDRRVYSPGYSGIVRLNAKAGQTLLYSER